MQLTAHSAECEEGMPPESTIARMSQTPFFNRFVKIWGRGRGRGAAQGEGVQSFAAADEARAAAASICGAAARPRGN